MKVEVNGRTFEVSFSRNSNVDYFHVKNGANVAVHPIRYATNHSIIRSLAQKFGLDELDVQRVRVGLIWRVLDLYGVWHRRKKNAKT